jgi:adenylate kinase family enzyme
MHPDALLLIGPTGSGKSPLGDLMEREGIGGRRCLHFDFGSRLRAVAEEPGHPEGFDDGEHSFIRAVLEEGLLLENRHFPIAEKIVRHFLMEKKYAAGDLVILNGLPRHCDQARDMERLVNFRGLLVLNCCAEDVHARIRENSGGDRSGRDDDHLELVRKKLRIFSERTEPLIEHFASAGTAVVRTRVTPQSTARDCYTDFCRMLEGKL